MCRFCPKLKIKTPERRQWRRSGVSIFNVVKISHCSGVSTVDFEQMPPRFTYLLVFSPGTGQPEKFGEIGKMHILPCAYLKLQSCK